MHYPKLKHTWMCLFLLFLPTVVLFILGLVIVAIYETFLSVIVFILCMLAALAYLLLLFPFILGTEVALDKIRYWKKDRLWFSLDGIGENPTTVKTAILRRIEKHGETCTDFSVSTVVPLCVRYKRYSSLSANYSSMEKNVYVYDIPQLDKDTYYRILESAKQITAQLKKKSHPSLFLTKEERKSPVCRAVAVIILTDFADPDIPPLVRKRREYGDTALLPCVVELSAQRCVFDGMRDVFMSGATPTPSKNVAIGLVTKLVFCGRLPLEGNDAFDFSQMEPEFPETTLWEHFRDFREAWKKDKTDTAYIIKRMQNGEVLEKDDVICVKLDNRITSFLIDREQTPYTLMSVGFWEHPKHQNIAKADKTRLQELVICYFATNNQAVVFEDDE